MEAVSARDPTYGGQGNDVLEAAQELGHGRVGAISTFRVNGRIDRADVQDGLTDQRRRRSLRGVHGYVGCVCGRSWTDDEGTVKVKVRRTSERGSFGFLRRVNL